MRAWASLSCWETVTNSPAFLEATGRGYVLSETSAASKNPTSREEELRQVRARQQEVANQRAIEAAKLRKEKEDRERERKNQAAQKSTHQGGDRLDPSKPKTTTRKRRTNNTSSRSDDRDGYNPMQPWSSHTSGYRYVRTLIYWIPIVWRLIRVLVLPWSFFSVVPTNVPTRAGRHVVPSIAGEDGNPKAKGRIVFFAVLGA